MTELRKDPVSGRWVIISPERGKRPSDFSFEEFPEIKKEGCPFCEGNETITPPEIFSYRKNGTKPDTPGWRIRVVPNKFPALRMESKLNKKEEGIYEMMSGVGAHEVIVETPKHIEDILVSSDLKVAEEVIKVYRQRMIELMKDARFEYVLVFKNKGKEAGASLNHSHSQIIATPVVPKRVEEELEGSRKYFNDKEKCVFCDMIRQEISMEERLLWEDEYFISFCPFASRFPYEMTILPKRHTCDFREINQKEIKSFARMLKNCIKNLNRIVPHLPYNYLIHTCPSSRQNLSYYHWHLEIIPRLTVIAGFEWGAGFYINYMPPEKAAKNLRA
ncbi:MAG TPA: galactose-1-phosphate uridylyltransferase [Candidatus Aerophobetes bacterium]|uniref:Galactose-1-phosphate uridylyltransferase n=1 Tax=Aerophobetes bacterium TaxID=2030807 RepID=A0A7V5HXX5_UNCAE|nr:galactose-1-phosphate uridylyltransferase [Candidatus Aerophobetes bacterium]